MAFVARIIVIFQEEGGADYGRDLSGASGVLVTIHSNLE